MPETVIQTRGLTKYYRHPLLPWRIRARALISLDLQVFRGEAFALLGPNGSGKSTTIKLLLGLSFPTSGSVSLLNASPSSRAVKCRIGYLPEESYLYPFLTPLEILDYYGRLFSLPRSVRLHRIDSLLDFVGLQAQKKRAVGEFSKGMQRRVALAQSLINDPDLIILDEPTAGLDAIGIAEIKALILELKSRGKTVLMCSHRMADVEDVCDRLTILYGGRAQVTGAVHELVQKEKLTQIVADLDVETTRAVSDLIRERRGADARLSVTPALEKLEHYFLRVVRDAEKNTETSGAAASSLQGLNFLSRAETPGDE